MARGSGRDNRDVFGIDRVRMHVRATDPEVAPQKGHCEVYIKNNSLWKICDNGVASAITGVGFGASPGFTWGRTGNINAGSAKTWLINDEVPSNVTGRIVELASPVLRKIYVTNSESSSFTVTVIEHSGTVASRNSLISVALVATRSQSFDINVPMTSGKELAVQITSGTAKNPVVGVLLDGTL